MKLCRAVPAVVLLLGAACRPPASDRYVERIALDEPDTGPRVQMASPDVEGAGWAESGSERIVFGHPGKPPLLAIECAAGSRLLKITRFAETDPGAKGMMALVGNGHVARLKIDALAMNGNRGWLWQGRYDPADPRLEALTGVRRLELTIPGAGTIELEGSDRPRTLIERCRQLAAPAVSGAPPLPPA